MATSSIIPAKLGEIKRLAASAAATPPRGRKPSMREVKAIIDLMRSLQEAIGEVMGLLTSPIPDEYDDLTSKVRSALIGLGAEEEAVDEAIRYVFKMGTELEFDPFFVAALAAVRGQKETECGQLNLIQ